MQKISIEEYGEDANVGRSICRPPNSLLDSDQYESHTVTES